MENGHGFRELQIWITKASAILRSTPSLQRTVGLLRAQHGVRGIPMQSKSILVMQHAVMS